jgi:hypothetical protein
VQAVTERHDFLREQLHSVPLDRTALKSVLRRLKPNSAPGPDGITAEHLIHAQCDSLLDALSDLCSTALSRTIVPKMVRLSTVVPVLKKKTLDRTVCLTTARSPSAQPSLRFLTF